MLKKTPENERQKETQSDVQSDDALYCARCGHLATRERWQAVINGDHLHTVFNPAGHLFRVRCFERAPGAAGAGDLTDYFTWFRGYDWQFALCRGCGEHLGWLYRGEGSPAEFAGLIATRLTTTPD